MAKGLKATGSVLLAAGLATMLAFAVYITRDEAFAKSRLRMSRNPGNVMYETEYFVALTMRAFLACGAVGGGLLALNGGTMLVLGVWVGRVDRINAALASRASG